MLYYMHPKAFSHELGLADLYARNKPLNQAIGSLIHFLNRDNEMLRIQELSSGGYSEKWSIITERLLPRDLISITLSDFEAQILPPQEKLEKKCIEFHTTSVDIMKPLTFLPPSDRYDCIHITYGFDSVWMPEDLTLRKEHAQWFRVLYPFPKQYEDMINSNELINAIDINDIKKIPLHPVLERISLETIPYGNLIEELYQFYSDAWVHLPGGMITRTMEAFERSLKPSGTIIIGDVIVREDKDIQEVNQFERSGKIALFKIEDYRIAKHILEEQGFFVYFIELSELLAKFLTKNELQNAGGQIALFPKQDMNCLTIISRKPISLE